MIIVRTLRKSSWIPSSQIPCHPERHSATTGAEQSRRTPTKHISLIPYQGVRTRNSAMLVLPETFTASPLSPSHLLPASPCPEAPQDSSLPALPPAYRLIPAMALLQLRDRLIRLRASPAKIVSIPFWS